MSVCVFLPLCGVNSRVGVGGARFLHVFMWLFLCGTMYRASVPLYVIFRLGSQTHIHITPQDNTRQHNTTVDTRQHKTKEATVEMAAEVGGCGTNMPDAANFVFCFAASGRNNPDSAFSQQFTRRRWLELRATATFLPHP